jgi:PIN domain nuclease of toxin-antitoxin system
VAVVLLDTCAAIWIGNRALIAPDALQAIRAAARTRGILVSAVTGWEIGLATTRPGHPLVLLPTAQLWLADLLARPGFGRYRWSPKSL